MLKYALSAAAVGLCALPALGQIDQSKFNLTVAPVLRTYTDNHDGTYTAADTVGPVSINTSDPNPVNRTVRLELRYKVTVTGSSTGMYAGPTSGSDATPINYQSAGLSSASMNLLFSKPVAGTWLQPAPIGNNLLNANPGYANPDPAVDPGAGYGVYAPWRTGVLSDLFGNNNNGALTPLQISNILPISTSSPNQVSSQTGRQWSFYAIDFVVPFGYVGSDSVTFSVERNFVNGNPSPWLFFPRAGLATTNAIQGLGTFTGGSVTINFQAVPAPAAAATLALGGLAALRRRR